MLSEHARGYIIEMHKKGKSSKAILEVLHVVGMTCSLKTVQNIKRLWRQYGSVAPRNKIAKRNPKCTRDMVEFIDNRTRNDRFLKASDLAKKIRQKYGK